MFQRLLAVVAAFLVSAAALAESSVWRVETARGAVYLAGSVHVLRAADYPLPTEFEAAYADAEMLVFETDLDATNQHAARQLLMARGLYGAGETIKDHLSPAVYQRLAEHCRTRNLSLDQLRQLKPWMLVMALTVAEMQANGFDFEAGLDSHLYRRAQRDGLPVHGLEDMDTQIDALGKFDGQGDPLISNFLDEAQSYPQLMAQMVRAWRAGDTALLDQFIAQEMREKFPDLYQAILVKRNRRWLPLLERWAESGKRVLVVIGAAHLVGSDSVIALLRQRGYRVEKLNLQGTR